MPPKISATTSSVGAILLVEDRQSLREMLTEFFSQHHYRVEPACSLADAREKFLADQYHLVLLDLKLPDGSGIDLLQAIRRLRPTQPIIMMTAYGTITDSVQAMRFGAVDFIQKPIDLAALLEIVKNTIDVFRCQMEPLIFHEGFSADHRLPRMVGCSPKMAETATMVQKIAATEATAFLIGESGTGKELLARTIHLLSKRKNSPFLEVNCAAIPETLLENEFFGHVRGAYTGADSTVKGKFDIADGGTLFLDEIGEIAPPMQVKLLKVLEEKRFTPIGGTHSVSVDVRIVAATNRDIEAEVRSGAFREDLYFRLAQFPVVIAPLRERREDILPLAEHFVREASPRFGKPFPILDESAKEALLRHLWPGNVRELKNAMERAVILNENGVLSDRDLFPAGMRSWGAGSAVPVAEIREKGLDACLKERLRRIERDTLDHALALSRGDAAAAADCLGISLEEFRRRKEQSFGNDRVGGPVP